MTLIAKMMDSKQKKDESTATYAEEMVSMGMSTKFEEKMFIQIIINITRQELKLHYNS